MEESTNYKANRSFDERSRFFEVRLPGSAFVGFLFGIVGVVVPLLGLVSGHTNSNQITIDVRLFSGLMGVLFGAAAASAYLILLRQKQQQSKRIRRAFESAELMNEWRLFEDLSLSAANVRADGKKLGDIRSALNSLFEQRVLSPEDLGWVQVALETRNNIAHRPQLEDDGAKIRLVGRQLSRVNHELRRRLADRPTRDQPIGAVHEGQG